MRLERREDEGCGLRDECERRGRREGLIKPWCERDTKERWRFFPVDVAVIVLSAIYEKMSGGRTAAYRLRRWTGGQHWCDGAAPDDTRTRARGHASMRRGLNRCIDVSLKIAWVRCFSWIEVCRLRRGLWLRRLRHACNVCMWTGPTSQLVHAVTHKTTASQSESRTTAYADRQSHAQDLNHPRRAINDPEGLEWFWATRTGCFKQFYLLHITKFFQNRMLWNITDMSSN